MAGFDRKSLFGGPATGVQWGYINTSSEFVSALDAWFADFFAGDANVAYQSIRIPGVRCNALYTQAMMRRNEFARTDRAGDANVVPAPYAVYHENWEFPARTDAESFTWVGILRHNRQGFKDMIDTATGNTGMLDPMDKCLVDIKIKDNLADSSEPRRQVKLRNEGHGIEVSVDIDYYHDLTNSGKIKFPGLSGNFADGNDWTYLWNTYGSSFAERAAGCFHRVVGAKDQKAINIKLKGEQIALPGDGPGGSSTNTMGFDTIFNGSVDSTQPFVLELMDYFYDRQFENDGVWTLQPTP